MSIIKKHQFEAVSLLTVSNGQLDVSIIPVGSQIDDASNTSENLNWIVPSSLILDNSDYDDLKTPEYEGQPLAVYSLLSFDEMPKKRVVLEGVDDDRRIGLLYQGDITSLAVRIADVKDALSEIIQEDTGHLYQLQKVIINEVTYIVPDLDALADHLINDVIRL